MMLLCMLWFTFVHGIAPPPKDQPPLITPAVGRYLGCWYDDTNRDLPIKLIGPGATYATCVTACYNAGYIFMGLQWQSQCWCGNKYGEYWKVDDSQCNYKCSSAPNDPHPCGDSYKNAIYALFIPNLAQGVISYSSCPSYPDCNGGYPYYNSYATDGNFGTRWAPPLGAGANSAQAMIYGVDLLSIQPIARVVIYWENNHATQFSIQYSDDAVTWNLGGFGVNDQNPTPSKVNLIPMPDGASARYVQVVIGDGYCCGGTHTHAGSIWEFEVHGYSGYGTWKPAGCWNDGTPRALPNSPVLSYLPDITKMTFEICRDACASIMGLQFASQCWCGVGTTAYTTYGRAPYTSCNQACLGNTGGLQETCGGTWLNQVYIRGNWV